MKFDKPTKGGGLHRSELGPNTASRTGAYLRLVVAASMGFPNMESFNAWAFAQSQEFHRLSVRDYVTSYLAAAYGGASLGTATAPVVVTAAAGVDYFVDVLGAGKFLSRLQVTAMYALTEVSDDVVIIQVFGIEPNNDFLTVYVPPGRTVDVPMLGEALRARGIQEGGIATPTLRIRISCPTASATNPVSLLFNCKAGPVPDELADVRVERAMASLLGNEDDDSDERAGRGTGAGMARLGRAMSEVAAPAAGALAARAGRGSRPTATAARPRGHR
jgi:hypothetical protein